MPQTPSNRPRINLPVVLLLMMSVVACQAQTYLGNYTSYAVNGKAVTIRAGSSGLRLVAYKPNLVRIDYLSTLAATFDSSLVVIRDTTEAVSFIVNDADSSLSIATGALSIVCRKYPLRLAFSTADGNPLTAEPATGGLSSEGSARAARFTIQPDEHFYGTGERGMSLDLRGTSFDSRNTQRGGYSSPPPATMNINVPFILSSRNYGIYFENTYPGHFDVGNANASVLSYSAAGGELSYFFMCDDGLKGVLSDYTWLTGTAPLPPRWAFGYIQSKYGYRNPADAAAMIQRMRADSIPCDAIVFDLYWFQTMGDLTWNTAVWPSPRQMIADFLSEGIKTIVITEPYIAQPSSSYALAENNGYLAKTTQAQTYVLDNWWSCHCNAGLLDITNPAAQQWWWSKYNNPNGVSIFPEGVAGVWTDLGEPERDYADMQFHAGEDAKIHNLYNFLWAKTVFDGFTRDYPDRRLLNLTRSGYAGMQRFNTITWSGDVSKTFGGLAVQLPFVLNMGLSGFAYQNSDIGGFTSGTSTAELYTRWMEFGAFCPVMRAHGHDSPIGTEPWIFGAATENTVRKLIELRYRLLPYNYTIAHDAYTSGIPLARPLVLDYPNDPAVTNESSAYLWGPSFLAAPVVTAGQTTQSFYLPAGKWIDYWTDQVYTGGTTVTVPAPIDRIPLFVRAGSIIPMQPVTDYVDQYPCDSLTLAVYPLGNSSAHFSLYEDDGRTLQYQHGGFATTEFDAAMAYTGSSYSMQMTIGHSLGSYEGKPSQRVYTCEIHNIIVQPASIRWGSSFLAHVSSSDSLQVLPAGWTYDGIKDILIVKIPASADSTSVITADSLRMTGIQKPSEAPTGFELYQNYPNPFNPATTIRFFLASRRDVTLKVYDTVGRQVASLLNGEFSPGFHSVTFDASTLPSGAYYYTLKAGSFSDTKSMVLVK